MYNRSRGKIILSFLIFSTAIMMIGKSITCIADPMISFAKRGSVLLETTFMILESIVEALLADTHIPEGGKNLAGPRKSVTSIADRLQGFKVGLTCMKQRHRYHTPSRIFSESPGVISQLLRTDRTTSTKVRGLRWAKLTT